MGNVISCRKNPVILSLLQNKEVGKVKINTGLIKIIAGLNKVKEEVKTLQKVIRILTRNL